MTGFASKLTLWITGLLIIICLISGWYIWHFLGSRGLTLDLEAPAEVKSGTPIDIKVTFKNDSGSVLNDALLTLSLPEGAAFWGSDAEKIVDNKSLGDIGVGGMAQETYKVIVFASEETMKDFKATVNYAPTSLNSRFDKTQSISIKVASSGMAVNLQIPSKVTSSEDFNLNISYQNVSDMDFSDLEMKVEYPPNFNYGNSSLKPDAGNNVWELGDLRRNSQGKLNIKGNVIGSAEDDFKFISYIYMRVAGQSYLINKTETQGAIGASPLSVAIHLNNNDDYAASVNDTLNYTISFINETKVALKEVVVRAQLIGDMFDFTSVSAQEIFRPDNNTLIWHMLNTPTLASLDPGAAGAVNFSIKAKNDFPIHNFSDKNFTLKINAEVESPTMFEGANSRIFSRAKLETKVAGNIKIDAQAYFRDANSGIINNGLFPPKVGQPTNFTIHWIIRNYANDISGVEVKSVLANNVKMVGLPRANYLTAPVYNESTREIVWRLDKIQANQGLSNNSLEAVFQVEAIPSSDQVGNYMPLMDQSFIKAHDEFTGIDLTSNDLALTTALPDDFTASQQGIVQK